MCRGILYFYFISELSNKFGLDPYVLVEVTKSFANHIDAPKKQFRVYSEPIEYSTMVPEVVEQVNQVSSPKVKEFVDIPPYPEKVKENLLTAIANKSSKRSEAPYEQTDLIYQVSVIKQLNEEEPCDVYLCEDSTNTVFGCAELGSELNWTFSFQILVGKELALNSNSVVWMCSEFFVGIKV